MRNKRIQAAQKKGGRRGSNSNDYISQMSDELLLTILSLLPIKEAVATCSLSPRWRFLWCNLSHLDFDGSKTLYKMANNPNLCVSERKKFINQVKSVIQNHNHPTVQYFRVRFDLDLYCNVVIDEWLKFAANKKVEILDLDLSQIDQKVRHSSENYQFPSRLCDIKAGRVKWLSPNATFVDLPNLTKLFLKSVNITDAMLQEFLANSPNLETISIHGAGSLTYVHVGDDGDDGERPLELKHLEIVECYRVRSIYLYEFDLESLTYKGPPINLYIDDLPYLEELDIGEGVSWLENNMFGQISCCLSYLQVLYLDIYSPKKSLKLDSVPELPMVEELSLKVAACKDDSLLEITNLAKACLRLETFRIELLWCSPMKRRKKVIRVANQPHEHLKNLEILGYYGRISDLELAVYVIDNAVGLKNILIDPHCQGQKGPAKTEKTARSSAKRQLESLMPRGVELVIL